MSDFRPASVSADRSGSRSESGDNETSDTLAPGRNIRTLIADDHAVIRLGITALLEAQPGFEVVAEATSCLECCKTAEAVEPDVVILDLEMGDCCGIQALEQLDKVSPKTRVVVFSAHANECLVAEVIKAGARGYVPKSASSRHLVDAVRTVCRGGAYLDPTLSSLVIDKLDRRNGRRHGAELSARESSVLKLLAQGKRNKEIANELYISERTVKFHVSALMQKLQAGNRTEAVKIAIGQGLVGS